MNTALMQYAYPITVIPPVLRTEYMQSLGQSVMSTDDSFIDFIAPCVHESQKEFIRLVEALQV